MKSQKFSSEVDSSVINFKASDEVYVNFEYAVTKDAHLALKPKNLLHVDAASIPLVTLTGLQALQRAVNVMQGGTVFIPDGLSGTGLMACQLAKHCFGAKKVITTVSTQKVDLVPKLLEEGVVNQIIDYKNTSPLDVIEKGSVDYFFDTIAEGLKFMPLIR